MTLSYDASGFNHTWLAWDRNNALSNFIQLHHCFQQDSQSLQVFFSSELSNPLELQVFVKIYSQPHVFHVDHSVPGVATPWFRAPVLDDKKAAYPADLSDVSQANDYSSWQMAATTRFPKDVRFERLYRFRYYVSILLLSIATNTPLLIEK